ncbi:MAG: chromosome segregation protein SMC [Armatimonadetes bacterium]|nr:chromosome segregation protein SMC [Armatimonadota bacterium]
MFIKSLEILGFKSFAEKTDVHLSSGITSVVGPNGCGKSNIADALMWVLGESNVRNIRAQRAVDVIFGGSDKKRPLGMAEVSLTLDNTCGTLPVSFNEVTVTRRAYRSGESEYFINKSRCRLKDIYELFLDTGIGREAYSFVTQGEIDAILSAKAEDRRELIEEAAGIKKYRYRREEANRKLDKTQANLLRVCDIMSELDGQLEPLAQQAEQARKYEELQSRLNEIEIGLLIRDLRRHTQSLEEVRIQKESAAGKLEEYDRRMAELEAQHEVQSAKLSRLEEEVENARRLQSSLSGNVQRLDSRAALLDERLNSAQTQIAQTDEEIENLSRRIEETGSRVAELEIQERSCCAEVYEIKANVEVKSRTLAELDKLFEDASRAVNDQKTNYLELAKEIAAKRNALQNSRQRIADLESAIAKHDTEITDLQTQPQAAKSTRQESSDRAESVEARIKELAVSLAQVIEDRKAAEAELADLNSRYAEMARQVAAKSSRLGALKEMAEAHEGFFEGVRSVMAASKTGKLAGDYAVVADVIDVPKGYEVAIETALGASVQDIIADTVDQAKEAIAFLKRNQAGRATFLPLDGLRNYGGEVRGQMDKRSGALGVAAELVKCKDKYVPAIRSLLARTVVAQNVDDAVGLSRTLTGWNRIVTLEGELIVPSGAITGGARKSKGPSLITRKQEIDTLNRELAALDGQTAGITQESEKKQQHISDISRDISNTEKLISESRAAHAEHVKQADFAAREAERILRQLETAQVERDETELVLKSESDTAEQLSKLLEAVGQENEDLDEKVAGAEQNIENLQQRRSAAREELMQLNAAYAAAGQKSSSLKTNLDEMRLNIERMTAELESRRSTAGSASTNVSSIIAERETVQTERERQSELLAAAEAGLKSLTTERTTESSSAVYVESSLKEITRQRNQLSEDNHEAEIREARLEVQVALASERLSEEYGISSQQAMDWPEEVEVERGTATEVARLRREIKDMGLVNAGAVQEYERIKERWDFLTAQREDMEQARDQISAAIREIDINTRGLFVETFNTVAANFDVMFKRLFGGGKTELALTIPNDLLETGISVSVQPPGKKLQDMALLSGGERALTACAFIFALLMAKPSPFVVLDEVDAPLDESNVERFVEVLKDFSKDSQFIVVTHNRATMEAADTLYGVTMQEPGISKIISVKLASEAVDTQERSLLHTV